MADQSSAPKADAHWGETNGKKYKRGSRLPKKTDARPTAPAAETPKVPWTWEEDGMTVIRGTARSAPGCHNVCGILSYVKDGKLIKVEGDPEDPYNQGRLCSRCLCIPDYVYHEDRLLKPMKRDRADRGKDKFVEISWDEAYDIVTSEFKRIAETYGADKIAMCQGTGRDIHQVTRLNACMSSGLQKLRQCSVTVVAAEFRALPRLGAFPPPCESPSTVRHRRRPSSSRPFPTRRACPSATRRTSA